MARRIDKEIEKCIESDMSKAAVLAKAVGYFVEVYDGDIESGMCEPIMYVSKIIPDIGADFYGVNF